MDLRPAPQPPASSAQSSAWGRTLGVALLVGIAAAGGTWWAGQRSRGGEITSTEHVRAVASRLRAAGALGEAARMYETALQDARLTREERGTQCYALGLLYLEDHKYEAALRWLYEAEAWGAGGDEVGAKIVHTLERLGRTNAAQTALATLTQPQAHGKAAERAADDPVVAEVSGSPIVRSEVIRALDDMPPEVAKQFKGKKGRADFLRKYVADELLWRKAQRLELDRDPEVQRRVSQALRQLAVARLLDKDVLTQVKITPSDIQMYFDAHQEQFKKTTLDNAKPQIEQVLRLQKSHDIMQAWVEKESTDSAVKLFDDKIGGPP